MPFVAQGLLAIGGGEITLTWNPSPSLDCSGYDIYQGATDTGPWVKINNTLIIQNTHPTFSLFDNSPGANYFFIRTWDQNQNFSDSTPTPITIPL